VDELLARARQFAASGAAPAGSRLAATVLLLRPAPGDGFEVYVQRRSAGMAFASGMYAFPGGAVDPADQGPPLDGDWAARLGRSPAEAAAVARAAVREVEEETGVRLAVADLVPWTRWITPEFEPRRYDTSFFLAALPDGQEPAGLSGEADRTEWLRPADAVARFVAGEIGMLPPTVVTLEELAGYGSVAAALAAAAARDAATPIQPTVDYLIELGRRWSP
jgi:8-oxo-dGTP pyrophosphatase MutT (NUDIX family)